MSFETWQLEKYGNILKSGHVLPPDERTEDEIMQDQFDKWQEQYEFDLEHENGKSDNN